VKCDAETVFQILEEYNGQIDKLYGEVYSGKTPDSGALDKFSLHIDTIKRYLKSIIQDELRNLLSKQEDEDRDNRIDEILAEVVSYDSKFEEYCGYRVETHPNTYRLMQVMTLIGWHVVMYFKQTFNRTRPSFLFPELYPAIVVPTHPSYPSGHATQSYLVALALCELFKNRDRFNEDELKPFSEGLLNLAKEIGTNREWAGVHYESDSIAGRQLATQLFEAIQKLSGIASLISKAEEEWYENT
jgi:acid phosphatase (class A)